MANAGVQQRERTDARSDFQPEDLFLEQRITDFDLSQDGQRIVCALKSVDRQNDQYLSQLWRVPLNDEPPTRLTHVPGLDRSPRWSPQADRIAFISDRHGGVPQIFLLPAEGGEAFQLTFFACAVVDLDWHPDGRQLLALCAINVDAEARDEGGEQLDLQRPGRDQDGPQVVWRLPYKSDGQGYVLGSRLQLVLVDTHTGDAVVLTHGDSEADHFCWSPDGRQLAFGRSRDDREQTHCSDLWCLSIDPQSPGKGADDLKCFRDDRVATATMPSWSPDGRWIAFLGAHSGGDPIMRLWLCDPKTGQIRTLGDEDLEVVIGILRWSEDSRRIVFIQAWRGLQRIVAMDIESGELQVLVQPKAGQVSRICVTRERIVYTEEGIDHPLEMHMAERGGGGGKGDKGDATVRCNAPRHLTQFNAWWNSRRVPHVERRTFQLPDGDGGEETVHGWLILPSAQPQGVPLLNDVHGGPASYVRMQWPPAPYWHVLANRGWAILALDAVGSSSYGREFSERLRSRWGELDLPQHEAAIDALQREGLADERVAIAGASYGGYMSAWAIGHTQRFKAAVITAPVGDLESHYGTSDSGYYADQYSMRSGPEQPDSVMKSLSPVTHIHKATTPALLIQGKSDQRCPIGQGEELFVRLQRAGVPSELVLYPGGSHHVISEGKPSHRLDAVQRIVNWLDGRVREGVGSG